MYGHILSMQWLLGRHRLRGTRRYWRRERGDLIQAYKVLTVKERVSFQTWFQMCLQNWRT